MNIRVKGVPFELRIHESGDCACQELCTRFSANSLEEVQAAMWREMDAERRSEHQIAVDKMMRLISFASFNKLGEFSEGQCVQYTPKMIGLEGRRLRAKLILEEAIETIEELGFRINDVGSALVVEEAGPPNMVGIVDGCFDLRVVTTGTLSALGVPDLGGQRLVDLNNLKKFGPGHKIRDDGKLIKPPDHQPPDLDSWLRSLGWVETTDNR